MATYTDLFDRPAETPLGSPWATLNYGGTLSLNSPGYVLASGGPSNYGQYYNMTMGDDHFSECYFAGLANSPGLLVRANADNGYLSFTGAGPTHYTYTIIANTYYGGTSYPAGPTNTSGKLYLAITGTTLRCTSNDVLWYDNWTDASLETGYGGLFLFGSSADGAITKFNTGDSRRSFFPLVSSNPF